MKTIFLAFLLVVGVTMAQVPQKIVVGGSNMATLGQVVSGYNNGYNVGIRIPYAPTTSVQEDTPIAPFVGWVAPNPCDRVTRFIGERPKSIQVFTLAGNELEGVVTWATGEITLKAAGTYIIKVTLASGSTRSFTIVSK